MTYFHNQETVYFSQIKYAQKTGVQVNLAEGRITASGRHTSRRRIHSSASGSGQANDV